MEDPDHPALDTTIELSAALAGGAAARGRQLALLRSVVAAAEGAVEVREEADRLRVSFATAHGAAACAIELQQRIEADNRTAAVPGVLRIAAAIEPGRGDRLCWLAGAGQILVDVGLWERLRGGEFDLGEPRRLGGPDAAAEIRWDPLPEPSVPLPARLEVARPESFVGRAAELARLEPLLSRAAIGNRQVVLLGGEPGIGKSRLARELAVGAHARGATVLQGRCDEDLRMPYQPFVEALSHLVEHAADAVLERHVAEHGGELGRLVGAFGRRLPDAPPPRSADGDTERYLLFSAVAGLLSAEQAQRPVVLFLDDIQWADTPTLLLLRHLAAADLRLRLTIVATFRSTELDGEEPLAKLLADLHREPDVTRLELEGLAARAVAELAQEATGHALDSAGLDAAHTLQRRTSGNAFFVTEILRHHGADLLAAPLPTSVRDVLERRLQRLGDGVREPLAAAAVIGQEFDLELIGRMLGDGTRTDDHVAAAVDAAAEAALVVAPRHPGDRYAFAHGLIVTTLYEGLGPARRARLHWQAATALEELCGDAPGARVSELARHWLNAEPADLPRALRYTMLAGAYACAQLAPDDGVRWYRQGLELHEQLDGAEDVTRFELLVGLGDAQRQAGDPEFRGTLLEAAALARRLEDGPRLVRAVLANSRGFVSASGVVDDERLHALEDALVAVGDGDSPDRAVLLATLAAELSFSPADRARRVALSDEALALARRLDHPAALSRVLSLRFVTLWMPETLEERVANSDENVAAARRTGDPVAEFHAVHWRAAAFVEAGRISDAWRDVEHEASLAERLGQPTMQWLATYDRANLEVIAGRLTEAEQHAQQALEIATASAQPDALPFFTSQLTNIRYEQGRLAELQPLIAQVVAENPGIPAFRAVLALACCEGDLDDEARRLLGHETATAFGELPPDVTWLPGLVIYAEVAAHLQDRGAATVLYDLLLPWAGQVVFSGVSAWGCVDHHLGAVAGVIGRFAEAEEHLRRAAELNAGLRAPIWAARTELATARLLLQRDGAGDRERGRALLERAAAASQRLGSATLARRANGLLGYEKALSALPAMPLGGGAVPGAAEPPGPDRSPASPPARGADGRPGGGSSATLRLEGEIWTVTGADAVVRLKDRKGLQYLATLLERPDVEVHAIDLVSGPVDAGARGGGAAAAGNGEVSVTDGGDAGELLDAAAKAAYRERVVELREELEEAERFHDVERAAGLREELEFIGAELARAVGLGGRDRRAGNAAERARVNVTRAIRGAVRAIAEHDARLGHHLERSVRTGVFCAYQPGPAGPDSWRVTVER
jgi:tetratricopeptide (TPR) repeat protein